MKEKKNNDSIKSFVKHACSHYGAASTIYKDTIYIYGKKSIFRVCLTPDPENPHRIYTFYHQNHKTDEGDWHVQGHYRLKYGLFICITHDFNVEHGIPVPTTEDLARFCEDFTKLKKFNQGMRCRRH